MVMKDSRAGAKKEKEGENLVSQLGEFSTAAVETRRISSTLTLALDVVNAVSVALQVTTVTLELVNKVVASNSLNRVVLPRRGRVRRFEGSTARTNAVAVTVRVQ